MAPQCALLLSTTSRRVTPKARWPKRIIIEHLHDDVWGADLFGQMFAGGYVEVGRTRQNSLLELS